MDTQQVLTDMFKENTGSSMLDSGGAYGREWERNQTVDLDVQPYATLEVSVYNGEIEFQVERSAYKWCLENLDYNEEWDKKFQEFAAQPKYKYESWGSIIEEWAYSLKSKYKVQGYFDSSSVESFNTYNSENNLSQTLQFSLMTIYTGDRRNMNVQESLCILQVHGGCDVRGGYTSPRVFNCDYMFGWADGNIGCKEGHNWYTDDCYHWYPNENEIDAPMENTLFGNIVSTIQVKELTDYKLDDFDFEYTDTHTGIAHCPVCKSLGEHNPLIV